VAKSSEAVWVEILGTLGRIEGLLRARNRDEGIDDEPACPKCGGTDLMDTSTMGNDRMTCRKCGVSMSPQEVVNG
jgi:ribosomal protein S27AE